MFFSRHETGFECLVGPPFFLIQKRLVDVPRMAQSSRLFSLEMAVVSISLVLLSVHAAEEFNILSFGAVDNNTSIEAATANGNAVNSALVAANASVGGGVVVIPAGHVFTMVPHAQIVGLRNVTLMLLGTLNVFPGNISLWPQRAGNNGALHFLEFDDCAGLSLIGNGTIIGNGYHWWVEVFATGVDDRPNMLIMDRCIDVLISGWTLLDSPMYHVGLWDVKNVIVEHVVIHVNVFEQKQLLASHGYLSAEGWPTFPLNTDGIDVSGFNITVRHCRVENFDDSVCAKPCNKNCFYTSCSEQLHFHDIHITNGVGASVGSVPPNTAVNCIRNVTFERIYFDHPIKAIYVKPNPCPHPATDGTGIIDLITYKDIFAQTPLWWSIWVSTQQQHQPHDDHGTGCSFFYPLPNTSCPTQPCVPVTRLTITNFTAVDALLSPGVLRCNPKGPCHDWSFTNVTIKSLTGFNFGENFLCEGLENFTVVGGSNLSCISHVP